MGVRQVLQCPHFNTCENLIFLSGLALEMGYHISSTLLQNKGMFIHLPDCFIPPTPKIKGIYTSFNAPLGPTAKASSSLTVSALQEN